MVGAVVNLRSARLRLARSRGWDACRNLQWPTSRVMGPPVRRHGGDARFTQPAAGRGLVERRSSRGGAGNLLRGAGEPARAAEGGGRVRRCRDRRRQGTGAARCACVQPGTSRQHRGPRRRALGDTPPATGRKTLQTYVANLRRALGADLIVTEPAGDLLRIESTQLTLADPGLWFPPATTPSGPG
jgi:hypothetical protein